MAFRNVIGVMPTIEMRYIDGLDMERNLFIAFDNCSNYFKQNF